MRRQLPHGVSRFPIWQLDQLLGATTEHFRTILAERRTARYPVAGIGILTAAAARVKRNRWLATDPPMRCFRYASKRYLLTSCSAIRYTSQNHPPSTMQLQLQRRHCNLPLLERLSQDGDFVDQSAHAMDSMECTEAAYEMSGERLSQFLFSLFRSAHTTRRLRRTPAGAPTCPPRSEGGGLKK